ncbi:flagellar biosynthesis protein FlhB [Lentisalinibacter orientalis]|uniref:flagellar biosynthesis protein FlhB n=1 Tax=Lentisalinibacter orientalis TaxID=2992241 RepID=UPI00386E9749
MSGQQEQFQEKTEQATPKRREDARKKGDVARSKELTTTGVMLCGSAALAVLAGPIGGGIVDGFTGALVTERAKIMDAGYGPQALAEAGVAAVGALAPFFLVVVAAALLSSVALGGWAFSVEAIAFKGERLSVIKGVKRIFSMKSLNELLKAVAKFAVVATAAVIWLWLSADRLLGLGTQTPGAALGGAAELLVQSLIILSASLLLIAAVDVPFQLWDHAKKLRMTRQEVRDEQKDTEGRPEVRQRIRQLQQEVATRRMMEAVPEAAVIITNPTHYAVALAWDSGRMSAPRVVAKGRDLIAARIRALGEQHDVPLFSAPPLARALYASTRIGQEIPAALYTAVAQVLAYIFQLRDFDGPAAEAPEAPEPDVDESLFTGPGRRS